MKLSQLGLTSAGQKATKKLTHQVHKTTVAAAMEPKLKLGVVGIEIGQEQSTGPTSRVNEAVDNLQDKIALIRKTAAALRYTETTKLKLPASTDRLAWTTAIEIGRLYDDDGSAAANAAWDAFQGLVMAPMGSTTLSPANEKRLKKMKDLGISTTDEIRKLRSHQFSVLKTTVMEILDFFDWATEALSNGGKDEFDALDTKFVVTMAKKLGFQT